jgi:hypothetical protein
MSRPHTESGYNALTSAFKAVLDDVGGIDAMASFTRVKRSAIGDYSNRFVGKFVPVDVVLDAETIGQVPRVTAALARAQGYELVRFETRSADKLAVELARIGRDCGDLFANATSLLGGGKVSDKQRLAMIADLDDLGRAAREAVSLLSRKTDHVG